MKQQTPRRNARLILEDGSEFSGFSFGKPRSQAGEVVFHTGMAGLPQTLTDPCYRGQILVSAYPLATDYGIPADPKTGKALLDEAGLPLHLESPGPQIAGFAVSELCEEPQGSAVSGGTTLSSWFEKNNVPGIYGIDTRALVLRLRDNGVMRGKILVEGSRDVTLDSGVSVNPVEEVSRLDALSYRPAGTQGERLPKIILLDCGVKANIIRCLLERKAEVLSLPWNHDLRGLEYDGLLLSSGPGDPKACGRTIAAVRQGFDRKKPIFGIGLGCQIMALAAGADTYKLPQGHRGQNQPCLEQGTFRCFVTSQNHGYAVRGESLPQGWEPWFINGNDHSIEGIRSLGGPFQAVQFQSEGCPGPRDTEFLFDQFLSQINNPALKGRGMLFR